MVAMSSEGKAPEVWLDAGSVATLVQAGKSYLRSGGRNIVIVHEAGQFHAFVDSCPHQGASLWRGKMGQGVVTCPVHGLRFRLDDGRFCGGPDTGGPRLKIFQTTVRDGNLYVQSESLPVVCPRMGCG